MATDRAARSAIHAVAPPAANDANITRLLEKPPILWLRQGATRVVRENERSKPDELWRGDGYSMDPDVADDVPLYFRLADGFTVVAELASATIARALGLPTPQPYLLNIGGGTLDGSARTQHDKATVCVATLDVGGTTFGQLLREESGYARRLLREWQHLVPTVAFDEWMANPDRNMGNILFVARNLWLIDHAEAFGGSTRKLFPLGELTDMAFTNKLALILEGEKPAKLVEMLTHAREWIVGTAGPLDVTALGTTTDMHQWHSEDEERELIDFVRRRLQVTHKLLCQRLGHPQLSL